MTLATSLVLAPGEPTAIVPYRALLQALRHSGLTGETIANKRWLVGAQFHQLVTFAGCSPHLKLEPGNEGEHDFTHVQVHADVNPGLVHACASRSRPRCGHCGKRIGDWLGGNGQPSPVIHCPSCQHRQPATDLDWRDYGIRGASLIEIHQVFPGEATPSDALLQALAAIGAGPWHYAWTDRISPDPAPR